jgi:hypothetical protein
VPVTIAHPIAAIPLRRPLGRLGVLSALVIGSVTPDLPLFLPLPLTRTPTHSLSGLFWFCLPVGLVVYLLFDRVLERPLRALMPEAVQRRLPPAGVARPLPWSPAVFVSVLLGAATHVAWDAFTHGESVGVRLFPALESRLFSVSGYTVYVFTVLQHASSAIGTLVMAAWIARWYRTAPQGPLETPGLTPKARRWLLLGLGLVVLAAAVSGGASRFPEVPTLRALQRFARAVIVAALSSLCVVVTLYGVIWHWMRARNARET